MHLKLIGLVGCAAGLHAQLAYRIRYYMPPGKYGRNRLGTDLDISNLGEMNFLLETWGVPRY
jgi:hypothetical protein